MPLNINKSKSLILASAASVAMLGASFVIASSPRQIDQEQPRQRESQSEKVRVGTYEPQAVFQSSPHSVKLNERIEQLQQDAQQAQQEGDQQRVMEIQGQMQSAQNEVVQEFLEEVEETLPELAKEANVKIVALQVVWTDPELDEPKDLSQELIARLNGGQEGENERQERSPFAPPSR